MLKGLRGWGGEGENLLRDGLDFAQWRLGFSYNLGRHVKGVIDWALGFRACQCLV